MHKKLIPSKQIVYGSSHHTGTKNVVRVTARYCFHYLDRYGELKYGVIRIEGKNAKGEGDKDFLQRRKLPDGGKWYDAGDAWIYYDAGGRPVPWSDTDSAPVSTSKTYYNGPERRKPGGPYTFNMRGVDYELYHLPEVIAASQGNERIFLVEGEKKCDALRARPNLAATTFAGGANANLEGRRCYDLAGARQLVVLADSDPTGVRVLWSAPSISNSACLTFAWSSCTGMPPNATFSIGFQSGVQSLALR